MAGNELDIKPKGLVYNYLRVRSWLRMNAGGVPNTCKSSEKLMNDSSEEGMSGQRRTGE